MVNISDGQTRPSSAMSNCSNVSLALPKKQVKVQKLSDLEKDKSKAKVTIKKKIEGYLDLEGFDKLKRLECYNKNSIEKFLNIGECNSLEEIYCQDNKLVDISFLFELSYSKKLICLNISGNFFSEQDLSFLEPFENLKKLYIKNTSFFGSLKYLRKMSKLEELDISDTNINEGLESLPEKLEKIACSSDENRNTRSLEIKERLKKYRCGPSELGKYNLKEWRKHNKKLIEEARSKEALEDDNHNPGIISPDNFPDSNQLLQIQQELSNIEEILKDHFNLEEKVNAIQLVQKIIEEKKCFKDKYFQMLDDKFEQAGELQKKLKANKEEISKLESLLSKNEKEFDELKKKVNTLTEEVKRERVEKLEKEKTLIETKLEFKKKELKGLEEQLEENNKIIINNLVDEDDKIIFKLNIKTGIRKGFRRSFINRLKNKKNSSIQEKEENREPFNTESSHSDRDKLLEDIRQKKEEINKLEMLSEEQLKEYQNELDIITNPAKRERAESLLEKISKCVDLTEKDKTLVSETINLKSISLCSGDIVTLQTEDRKYLKVRNKNKSKKTVIQTTNSNLPSESSYFLIEVINSKQIRLRVPNENLYLSINNEKNSLSFDSKLNDPQSTIFLISKNGNSITLQTIDNKKYLKSDGDSIIIASDGDSASEFLVEKENKYSGKITNYREDVSISFDLTKAEEVLETPVVFKKNVEIENTKSKQTTTLYFDEEVNETKEFRWSPKLSLGGAAKITGGIPHLVGGELAINLNADIAFIWRKTDCKIRRFKEEVPVECSPGESIDVSLVVKKGKLNVPFVATITRYFEGTKERKYTYIENGEFSRTDAFESRVKYEGKEISASKC